MKRKLTPEDFRALPKIAKDDEEMETLKALGNLIEKGMIVAFLGEDGDIYYRLSDAEARKFGLVLIN